MSNFAFAIVIGVLVALLTYFMYDGYPSRTGLTMVAAVVAAFATLLVGLVSRGSMSIADFILFLVLLYLLISYKVQLAIDEATIKALEPVFGRGGINKMVSRQAL